MKHLPKVSCLCPTFARPNLLEEAIESFLRQDYEGEKELVIVNDFPYQTLKMSIPNPQVIIANTPTHIVPLGKKFNVTAALATGEYLMVWDDDDIYLPHRISHSVKHIANGVYHTNRAAILQDGKYELTGNYFHGCLMVAANTFKGVGGYDEQDMSKIDLQLLDKIRAKTGFVSEQIATKDLFYIYRWGETGAYHISSWGDKEPVTNVAMRIAMDRIRRRELKTGSITLNPHWKIDYVQKLRQDLAF